MYGNIRAGNGDMNIIYHSAFISVVYDYTHDLRSDKLGFKRIGIYSSRRRHFQPYVRARAHTQAS